MNKRYVGILYDFEAKKILDKSLIHRPSSREAFGDAIKLLARWNQTYLHEPKKFLEESNAMVLGPNGELIW